MKRKNIIPISIILIPYLIIAPILWGMLTGLLFPDPQALDAQLLEIPTQNPTLWETIIANYIPVNLFILFPISLILNVVCAFFFRWDTAALAKWNLRIKLCLIPFYLFAFVFSIGVPLAIIFIVIFEVLLLLSTSCYGFRAAFRARKDEKIGDGMFVLLSLCHFCFVADVGAALILHRKLRSRNSAQNL